MTSFQGEIILIALCTAIATALPGVFLILRGVALMSDAISHAILLGIAVMFLIVQRLDCTWLFMGAAVAGLLTVFITEQLINNTRHIKKDAAIGLVFPLFFSIGIILINQYAHSVHLDTDMVLLGELAFAPFSRWTWLSYDMGPVALWTVGIIMIMNALLIALFYKEFTVATFDKDFAYIAGFRPTFLHYLLMGMTSMTTIGAFDVVGSIVVVALIITPPATAYLLTRRLSSMIFLSLFLGMTASLSGYCIAHLFDVSIAGSIASACGFQFLIALCLSPYKGIFAQTITARRYKEKIFSEICYLYLNKQETKSVAIQKMSHDLGISHNQIRSILTNDLIKKTITLQGNTIALVLK